MTRSHRLIMSFILSFGPSILLGEEPRPSEVAHVTADDVSKGESTPQEAAAVAAAEKRNAIERAKNDAEDEANKQIKGIKFGVGIGATWGAEQIVEAEVIDGTTRVTKSQKGAPGFWLETHLLIPMHKKASTKRVTQVIQGEATDIPYREDTFGVGPFLAIQSSTDNVLDAMAAGIMFGFRRPGKASNSLSLGVGVAIDPHFQVLGSGFVADEAPPGTETEVRYATKSQPRAIMLFGFAF